MAVALLALTLSLTGVSYGFATGAIDGREILNNSVGTRDLRNNDVRGGDIRTGEVRGTDIRNESVGTDDVAGLRGRDLRHNSIGGAQVHEQGLALVPAATTATIAGSANRANSAGSVDGSSFATIYRPVPAGALAATVLDGFGGLTLVAACAPGSPSLTARSAFDNALIHSSFQRRNEGAGTVESYYDEDDDFDVGDSLSMVGNLVDSMQGSITYARPGGGVTTVTLAVEHGTGLLGIGGTGCAVVGHAQSS